MAIPRTTQILAINGGSSSIKFALFDQDDLLAPVFDGEIRGIGGAHSCFLVRGSAAADAFERKFPISDRVTAVAVLAEWLVGRLAPASLAAIAHRVVHGGAQLVETQAVTGGMLATLYELVSTDPEHLPLELHLIETLRRHYPDTLHVACFDSAFHVTMPPVASMMPIPRRFYDQGIKRLGYHGLSCSYLMRQLGQLDGQAAAGKVILAHLGGGASITAVMDGRSRDTSMGFTPASGIPMGTRSGDIDPGLAWHCARHDQMTPARFNYMVNHESGLLGVSGSSGDLRELMVRESTDTCAAEAVAMFCYQARKQVCAMAGALNGVDTLVFAGGVGENSAAARARICDGLSHLGVVLDHARNVDHAAVISAAASAVVVRVMRTDEQWMLADEARGLLARTSRTPYGSAAHG
jgi:acetate kinase